MTETKETEPTKTCLECGQPLGAGRRDRRYCNDICRTAYNNRRRYDSPGHANITQEPNEEEKAVSRDLAAIQRVYNILLENRIKLYNLYNLFERAVPKDDFDRFGINLNYFTSIYTDDYYEKPFRMCFDYGYYQEGKTVYLVYHGNEVYCN